MSVVPMVRRMVYSVRMMGVMAEELPWLWLRRRWWWWRGLRLSPGHWGRLG